MSPETIRAAAADPRCKQKGFSFEEFDIGTEYPQIGIGMAIFKKVDSLIEIYGQSILSISPPLQAGLPFRINAFMTDTHGMTILEIIDNEWRAAAANWDVEVGGGRTAIRRGPGDIALRLRIISPGALVIDRIDMQHLGVRVRSRDGGALYVENAGTSLSFKHVTLYDMLVGLYVTKHGVGCGRGRTPPRRNSRCYCFSGLRYKECCGAYVSRPG